MLYKNFTDKKNLNNFKKYVRAHAFFAGLDDLSDVATMIWVDIPSSLKGILLLAEGSDRFQGAMVVTRL